MKSYTDEKIVELYCPMDSMEIRIHENGVVTYYYEVDDETSCEFGLLSEVGEYWQKIFFNYIVNFNLQFEYFETDDYIGERVIDYV